jgi:hypothetical protein
VGRHRAQSPGTDRRDSERYDCDELGLRRARKLRARIEPFQKAGLRQFVCPSVWNFNLIFPNNEFAAVNIRNFVRDGQAAGALGVMNTNWDDDGETLFEMTWYGVGLGAAAGWENAPLDIEKFDRKFDWAFFRAKATISRKNSHARRGEQNARH